MPHTDQVRARMDGRDCGKIRVGVHAKDAIIRDQIRKFVKQFGCPLPVTFPYVVSYFAGVQKH